MGAELMLKVACVSTKSLRTHFPTLSAVYSTPDDPENYLKFTWKTPCMEMHRSS